jgi:hypothetical protein
MFLQVELCLRHSINNRTQRTHVTPHILSTPFNIIHSINNHILQDDIKKGESACYLISMVDGTQLHSPSTKVVQLWLLN